METTPGPEYTGMDKYPGWIATIVTIAITAVFLGALYAETGGDHGGHGEHGATETHSEEAH